MRHKNYSKGVFLYLPRHRKRKSLIEQINFIKSLPNINHIEVWIEENLNQSELKTLKSSLKKYEILIHAPWFHLSLISPHPEVGEITVKLYIQTLKVADILGVKLVTFHCGNKIIYDSRKTTEKMFIQSFSKIKKFYRGKAPFAVENMAIKQLGPQISYPSFLDLTYLKKKLPWLNFTLDVGHVIEGGEDLEMISKFLKKYKNSVLDIHLHDAILKRESHLALGKGDLDFNKFFQILNKVGYTGYISLETISNEDTKKSWEKIYKL